MNDPSAWVYNTQDFNYDIAKHEDQRINRGFSDYDWYNANDYLAYVLVGMLKQFRECGSGYPAHLGYVVDDPYNLQYGDNIWYSILTEMIEGFEAHKIMNEEVYGDKYKEAEVKLNRALDLLKEYWTGLWD